MSTRVYVDSDSLTVKYTGLTAAEVAAAAQSFDFGSDLEAIAVNVAGLGAGVSDLLQQKTLRAPVIDYYPASFAMQGRTVSLTNA